MKDPKHRGTGKLRGPLVGRPREARQGLSRDHRLTSQPVDWADDVWEEVVANLTHKDNHNRAIAAQVLCNLARSD